VLIIYFTAVTALAKTDGQPEKQEIPLKDIWAIRMPGTRNLYDLEPDKFGPSVRKLSSAEQIKIAEKSLITKALRPLEYNKPGQSALQAFTVPGIGADALREAAAVLSGTKKPQTLFLPNSDLSIVFFSHSFSYYVHLDKVEKQRELIVISYRFVPHDTKEITRHFALIPIGKFPPGKVKVDIKRLPMSKSLADAGFKEPPSSFDAQVVAQSFLFRVKGKSD
jgi:hypothetical protein